MALSPNKGQREIFFSRLLVVVALLVVWSLLMISPQWWSNRQATPRQVRNLAVAAIAELNASLPGGAGSTLDQLGATLTGPSASTSGGAKVTMSQVKKLAKPFYDRLLAVGYRGQPLTTGTYPWLSSANPLKDYATIGQIEYLFSFDLFATDENNDTDRDGLADWWENSYFGHLGVNRNVDTDGDGLTNLQEYQQRRNPLDYYNGQPPIITKFDGDQQQCLPDRFTRYPLRVQVRNALNVPLVNAPVEFQIRGGKGHVALARNSATSSGKVVARTDAQGYAGAYLKVHSNKTAPNVAFAAAQGYAAHGVNFEAITNYNLGPAAPSKTNAHPAGVGLIEVTWQDNSNDEVNFIIERSEDKLNWEVVGAVDANVTKFTDRPPEDKRYYYRVSSTYGYE